MKIYAGENCDQTIVIMDNKEGRDLIDALERAIANPKDLKPLRKSTRVYKLVQMLMSDLPVYTA